HPVDSKSWQAGRAREWRGGNLEDIETTAEIEEEARVETGADLAAEDEVAGIEIPDQQGAESDAASLRIGEAADDELLCGFAFHLEPVRRPTMFVEGVASFGDDAFPP